MIIASRWSSSKGKVRCCATPRAANASTGYQGCGTSISATARAELADAASAQMRRIAFASAYIGATNEPAVRLAEKIVGHAYPNSAAVYFTTAGAESNESAFKFARYYWKIKDKPEKTKIISRIHAYHGVSLAAMSATGMAAYHKMFGPLVPGFIQAAPPYAYRWAGNEEPGIGAADAVEKAYSRRGPAIPLPRSSPSR